MFFEPLSFFLGFLSALLLVALAYRYRSLLARYREQIQKRIHRLRQRLTANTATRYRTSVAERAQQRHFFGSVATLESIYVEQLLLAPWAPSQDDGVPLSLSPVSAISANHRLAVIGRPGSGRTTLLHHLLLHHVSDATERVPVYAYLPELALVLDRAGEPTSSREDNPVHQLVTGTLSTAQRPFVPGVARWLQRQIQAGGALLLLDGWDELPPGAQPGMATWIQALATVHPDNRLLVTAGERGYAALVSAGLIPLQLAPWAVPQLTELAQRWQATWPSARDDAPGAASLLDPFGLTSPTAFEATLELVIRLRGQMPASTPAGKMAQLMDMLLPVPEQNGQQQPAWPVEVGHCALGQLAVSVLEQRQPILTREQVQAAVTAAMPSPRFSLEQESITAKERKQAREEEEQRVLQIVNCCRDLTATGAHLQSLDKQHFSFAHPLLAAYWTARHLAGQGDVIASHTEDPAWSDALRFYAGLAPAEPVITRLLSTPDDVLLSRLQTAAALLAAAPAGSGVWRTDVTKRLVQLWMAPGVPPLLRERALAALVVSGEAGIATLFRKTLASPDPLLRAGAVAGLGVLGGELDIPLIKTLLTDERLAVRLAVVNALSRMALRGNQKALELVVAALVEGDVQVQRAVAQALADLHPEGHAVLRDAAGDRDIGIRRAAVYGLAAIGQPWTKEMLAEMQRKDDEWLVRNAAAEALDGQAAQPVTMALPKAESESWLVNWTAERGEGTGVGDAALATVMRALHEGDAAIRQLAAETLGRLADPRAVDNLRSALYDPEPAVTQAALAALDQISCRHDMFIPRKALNAPRGPRDRG